MALYINGESQFSLHKESETMTKDVKCHNCGQEASLVFPAEFEGHPIRTYEEIRSYVDFLRWCKDNHSFGNFVWDSKGKEVWVCRDCNAKSVWYAGSKA